MLAKGPERSSDALHWTLPDSAIGELDFCQSCAQLASAVPEPAVCSWLSFSACLVIESSSLRRSQSVVISAIIWPLDSR